MTMSAAEELKKHLADFSDLHSQMGQDQYRGDGSALDSAYKGGKDNDNLIKSETFVEERKRYYMDLKENQRGRFLRVRKLDYLFYLKRFLDFAENNTIFLAVKEQMLVLKYSDPSSSAYFNFWIIFFERVFSYFWKNAKTRKRFNFFNSEE